MREYLLRQRSVARCLRGLNLFGAVREARNTFRILNSDHKKPLARFDRVFGPPGKIKDHAFSTQPSGAARGVSLASLQ